MTKRNISPSPALPIAELGDKKWPNPVKSLRQIGRGGSRRQSANCKKIDGDQLKI